MKTIQHLIVILAVGYGGWAGAAEIRVDPADYPSTDANIWIGQNVRSAVPGVTLEWANPARTVRRPLWTIWNDHIQPNRYSFGYFHGASIGQLWSDNSSFGIGAMIATFDEPTCYVSLWCEPHYRPEVADYGTLRAFDESGNLITLWSTFPNTSSFLRMYAPDIKYIEISGNASNGSLVSIGELFFLDSNSTAGQTIHLGDGATDDLTVPGGLTIEPTGGLTGQGNVLGSVHNMGFIRPGASPGRIFVEGDYQQDAGGRLEMEIFGDQTGDWDVLAVEGSTLLSGQLDVSLPAGFNPNAGETFLMIESDDITGSLELVGAAAGQFTLSIDNRGLSLVAIPEPTSAVLLAGLLVMALWRRRS